MLRVTYAFEPLLISCHSEEHSDEESPAMNPRAAYNFTLIELLLGYGQQELLQNRKLTKGETCRHR